MALIVDIARADHRCINVEGLLFMLQAAAKQMVAQGARISGRQDFNLAFQAGRRGKALVAAYCSSKAAVISLMQSARLGLIKHGINVNAIAPSVVDSEHWDHVDRLFARYEGLAPGGKKRTVGAAVPFGRMANRTRSPAWPCSWPAPTRITSWTKHTTSTAETG